MSGHIHVYTGDGKGKTTAAFGLALRAAGHGKRVFIGQFLKNRECGEVAAVSKNDLIEVEQFGESAAFVTSRNLFDHAGAALTGLEKARSALRSGRYDVVVLDEIDVALWYELLTQADCLELLDERPDHVDLVLTGRWAPKVVLDNADLITEMREVRHYYRRGQKARAGIEY